MAAKEMMSDQGFRGQTGESADVSVSNLVVIKVAKPEAKCRDIKVSILPGTLAERDGDPGVKKAHDYLMAAFRIASDVMSKHLDRYPTTEPPDWCKQKNGEFLSEWTEYEKDLEKYFLRLYFDTGLSAVDPAYPGNGATIGTLKEIAETKSGSPVHLSGWADPRPLVGKKLQRLYGDNKGLAKARATSVQKFLSDKPFRFSQVSVVGNEEATYKQCWDWAGTKNPRLALQTSRRVDIVIAPPSRAIVEWASIRMTGLLENEMYAGYFHFLSKVNKEYVLELMGNNMAGCWSPELKNEFFVSLVIALLYDQGGPKS